MNWKATGILLTAAAVLFAFVWWVDRPIRRERERQASRVILPAFDPGAVNHIEIKAYGTNDIEVQRSGGTNDWRMTRPISYPAQAGPIMALLRGLAELEWHDRIGALELKDETNAQEKYGFNQPQFELSLQNASGPQKILIGQSSALGDQAFMEVVGNPNIYLVGAALLQLTPVDKNQWRDLSLLDLTNRSYDAIEVRAPGRGPFKFERDPAQHLWLMTTPVAARADNARIDELLQRLQRMRVREFVSDDPRADLESYGLQTSPQTPGLDLSLWRGTNLAADLQAGLSPTNLPATNQPALVFARRGDSGNVVLVDRDPLLPWQGAYTNFIDYHFISVSPDSIRKIAVDGKDRFSVEKQTNGGWLVHSTTTFPADAALMRDWLASFTNVPTQIEKTVATDLAVYGLERPLLRYTLQAGAGAGGGSNALMAEIQFGASKSGTVFERRPDETFVNTISSGDFDRLPSASYQLRDRHIWAFETSNVLSLTVHQQGETRKFLRDPEGEWTLAPGFHGLPVNWPAIEEGVYRLGHLSAEYWTDVGDARWQELGFATADFNLSLEVKHGAKTETYSVAFGGRSPYSYPYASVELDGQRLIFEFPVELYDNFIERNMTIPVPQQHGR